MSEFSCENPVQEHPAARLPAGIGFLLPQVGFAVARQFKEKLKRLDLEPRKFGLLRLVADAEGQSQQALASALRVPASRLVALVDDLEDRGLLERRRDAGDRRVRALHLTSKGRALLRAAMEIATEHEASITASLEPAEREPLQAALLRIASDLGAGKSAGEFGESADAFRAMISAGGPPR